jgi:hypothetical protein
MSRVEILSDRVLALQDDDRGDPRGGQELQGWTRH